MKKLDIIVNLEKLNDSISAINKIGIGGMTVMHARGQGSAEPPLVGQLYSREIISVVVDDSKVDKLVSAVSGVACTKHKGDGKIFVTNIEDAYDLCSGKTGTDAI